MMFGKYVKYTPLVYYKNPKVIASVVPFQLDELAKRIGSGAIEAIINSLDSETIEELRLYTS